MKTNLSKEELEKIALGVIGGITVLALFTFLVFSPGFKKIGKFSDSIRKEKNNIEMAEKEIKDLPKMKADLKKLKESAEKYQLNMPEAKADWLLEKLYLLAGEAEVNFDKIEPRGNIEELGDYNLQGMYIELRTDYHRLGKFINKLESLSPFLKIINLSIVGNKDDASKHLINFTVGAYVSKKQS